MANTSYYKTHVEPFVRDTLERVHGVRFTSKVLALSTGGTHEFDAVAEDGSIVASIKSLSGKTYRGRRPAAKYSACIAELYYLSLASAPRRMLVLTTPTWHTMFMRHILGRLAPGLEVELIALPPDLQAEVDKVRDLASNEVSPSSGRSAAASSGVNKAVAANSNTGEVIRFSDDAWNRIVAFAGHPFYTATGLAFSYVVTGNAIAPDRTAQNITRGEFAKFVELRRAGKTFSEINKAVRGSSYIRGILEDDRVRSAPTSA